MADDGMAMQGTSVSATTMLTKLNHLGRVTHICVSKLTIVGSDKWLVAWSAQSHCLNQCWNIVNWTRRTNFSGILIKIQRFSFKKSV